MSTSSQQTSTRESVPTSIQSDNNIDNRDIEDNRNNTEDTILNNNILINNVSVSTEGLCFETSDSESDIPTKVLKGLEYIRAHKDEVIQDTDENDNYTNAAYDIMEGYEKELKNWICSIKYKSWDSTSALKRLSTVINEQQYESQADLDKTVMDLLTYQAKSEAAYEKELRHQAYQRFEE